MSNLLAKEILDFFENVSFFWQSQTVPSRLPFIVLDIVITTTLFYWLYILIRETRAWRIFIGLLLVFIFYILSKLLGLSVINWLFKNFFAVLIVTIPIVFQPELRVALEKLGRIKLAEHSKEGRVEDLINEIVNACRELAVQKLGALIVIQKEDELGEYIETGSLINADLSAALLVNIFQKNSSFHDGAVIINKNKIKAASCLLPLDERRFKKSLGTRHNAGLALSQETDALVIIISEERGKISFAQGGKLKEDISYFDLKQILLSELGAQKDEETKS